MSKIVWGLDPGFASVGLAICAVKSFENVPVPNDEWCLPRSLHVIETVKSDKKQNVGAVHDNFRRAQEIAAFLETAYTGHPPDLICAESMSFSPGASASAKLSMAWGVLAAFAYRYQLTVLQVSPSEIKRALGCLPPPRLRAKKGEKRTRSEADKDLVARALSARYGAPMLYHLLAGVAPSKVEHPLDGLAAVLACGQTNEMRMLRR